MFYLGYIVSKGGGPWFSGGASAFACKKSQVHSPTPLFKRIKSEEMQEALPWDLGEQLSVRMDSTDLDGLIRYTCIHVKDPFHASVQTLLSSRNNCCKYFNCL